MAGADPGPRLHVSTPLRSGVSTTSLTLHMWKTHPAKVRRGPGVCGDRFWARLCFTGRGLAGRSGTARPENGLLWPQHTCPVALTHVLLKFSI